jgi:methylated-DNA-[protein]-cysteine S-methyltransferase
VAGLRGDVPVDQPSAGHVRIELSEQRTPVGEVRIAMRAEQLVGLAFVEAWPRIEHYLSRWFAGDDVRGARVPRELAGRLDAYLAGQLEALDGLSLETKGTAFQRRVWTAIREVPAGEVLTYAELAVAVGSPNAARAVGAACGANPLELVIPCHRAVRADGDLSDYPGGEERKRWLLAHERRHAD